MGKKQIFGPSRLTTLAAAAYLKKNPILNSYQELFPRECDGFLSNVLFEQKIRPRLVDCSLLCADNQNNARLPCVVIDTKELFSRVVCAIPQVENAFVFVREYTPGIINIFDASQGKTIDLFRSYLKRVFALLVQDNNLVVAGVAGVKIFDLEQRKFLDGSIKKTMHSICTFGDTDSFAGIDRAQDTLFVYDKRAKEKLQHTIALQQARGHIVRSVNQHLLATGGNDATVKFWDIRKCSTGKDVAVQTYGEPMSASVNKGVQSFCIVNNSTIAAMHYDGMLSVWKIGNGQLEHCTLVAGTLNNGSVGGIRVLNERLVVFPYKRYKASVRYPLPSAAMSKSAIQIFDVKTGKKIIRCDQSTANFIAQDTSTVLHNNVLTVLGRTVELRSSGWCLDQGSHAQLTQWDFTKIVDAYSGKCSLDKMQTLLAEVNNKKELVKTLFSD
jgi:WD40 repeat protein